MEPVIEKVGDVTVITLAEEHLDAGNADVFRRAVAPALKDCRNLVLDLGRVQFVDSRGCGAILLCLKHVSKGGGDLKLCCVTEQVQLVFELIRMDQICQVTGTRDEAIQAFQNRTPS